MKASVSISIGDWYKSADVEIDSASESDIKFSKSVLSSVSKIEEQPKTVFLNIDGRKLAHTIKEAFDSAFADDVS